MAMPFLDEVGLSEMSPTTPVSRLSVGERHLVEVARLIAHKPRLLILDEPTAALGQSDSDRILAMVSRLKAQGKSVVYVSHRLDEIFRITDRCTVLRDGKSQISVATSELDTHKLVALMLGRELANMFPARPKKPKTQTIYHVRDLWPDQVLAPVNFEIRSGEILGLAGQLGSGAGEILAAIAGAGKVRGGQMTDVASGKSFLPGSPRQAIQKGIAYCSPDRKHDGLFLGRPIRENLSAPNLKRVSQAGFIQSALEKNFTTQLAKSFTIDVKRLDEDAAVLSGGNQQKVALGKWLSISPKVILVDEPTRGVDVGARAEIYQKIRTLVDEGAAVVIASTDLLEITNLPDRVITFYKGAVSAELVGEEITSVSILENITNPKNLKLSLGESA
jgi:ribose transport system ATP-binding protein